MFSYVFVVGLLVFLRLGFVCYFVVYLFCCYDYCYVVGLICVCGFAI